jgi:hypothetical protein
MNELRDIAIAIVLAIVGAVVYLLATPAHAYDLVYVRQPRAAEQFANWQHWYDGGIPDRFTEADLVLDDTRGTTTVIHDCTGDLTKICAAHDGRVSPDGKQIAYTLAEGDGLYAVKTWGTPAEQLLTDALEFRATKYSIWLYDIASKTTRKLGEGRMPDWLSNDELVFASNRANTYIPWDAGGDDYPTKSLQLYRAKVGSFDTAKLLTPLGVYAMNPAVLTSGEICYSEFNGYGPRGAGHTPANMWWLRCMNQDGTNNRVVLGAHGSQYLREIEYLPTVDPQRAGINTAFMLLRPVSEIHKGYLATGSYYRSNRPKVMATILGFPFTDAEGYSTEAGVSAAVGTGIGGPLGKSTVPGSWRFVPIVAPLTPFGTGDDMSGVGSRFNQNGLAMGNANYAAASPTGRFLFTYGRGSCYEGTEKAYNNRASMGGGPTCKTEIRVALVDQVADPFNAKQSITIACADEKYNCWDARYVAPYQVLFGQPAPVAQTSALTGTMTTLHIVNARAGEIFALQGQNVRDYDKITYQGNAVVDWDKKITGIRLDRIGAWTGVPQVSGFASTTLIGTYPLESDGSVSASFPCGGMYTLTGVDAAGNAVATDQTLHNAVCGEVVTCDGCHDGHSQERLQAIGLSAVDRFKTTIAATKPPGC